MTTQQTPFLLKVLSGSNAGALVRLKVGELVIGKSMASDIILHDEHIADLHLKLKVSEDAILLEVIERPVLIDNEEVVVSETVLRPYQVVTVGGVEFFVGDVRKPGRRQSNTNERLIGEVAGQAESGQFHQSGSATSMGFNRGQQRIKSSGQHGKKYLWLGLGVLLLANIIYFWPNLSNLAGNAGLISSPRERADNLLGELQLNSLEVIERDEGALITGYVDTSQERRQILTSLARVDSSGINHRIWVNNELVSQAKTVANALGQPDLSFKSLGEGRLAANGYVSNEEDWARIKVNIMGDVNGIQAIEDGDIQTLIKRKQALEQFIDKKGLSSRIRVTIDQTRIKVEGELTQSELKRWDDLYREFVELNGSGPAIVNNLFDAKDRIKLAIRSVSVGETPFLVSKDGKKYMEGSSLGSNYFIKKITSDHIILLNNGVEIPIYYGLEDQ